MEMNESAEKLQKVDKPEFRFTINRNRISKKNKELLEFEDLFTEDSYFRKLICNGSYYDRVVWYYDLLRDKSDIHYNWYHVSPVLSNIYDIHSISSYILDKDQQESYRKTDIEHSVLKLKGMLKDYSKETLKLQRISEKKYHNVCLWFCYHLFRTVKYKHIAMKYMRDENIKKTKEIDNPDFSYSIMLRLIDMLKSMGLITDLVGNNVEGSLSSMLIINPILVEMLGLKSMDIEEVEYKGDRLVEVRDANGAVDPEDYIDGLLDEIEKSEEILVKFVCRLNKSDVNIGEYQIPYLWYKRILRNCTEEYGRVFDDGTIQGKSKSVRVLIYIDQEATVSLDYKSLHPRLLYLLEGIKLEDTFDPYPSVDIDVDKRLINRFKKFYGIEKYDPVRNLCKVALLCMINAETLTAAKGACFEAISKDWKKAGSSKEQRMKFVGLNKGFSLNKIFDEILRVNAPISKYFGKGFGTRLQNLDSRIIMRCLEILTEEDKPVLPIHDSLICKVSDKKRVKEVMEQAYYEVMGSQLNCIVEEE